METNWNTIISAIVGIGHIFFGIYVYLKNSKEQISKIFLLSALSIAVWLLSMAAITSGHIESRSIIVILDRITFALAPVILISIALYLKDLFPGNLIDNIKKDKMLILISVFGAINLLLSPTNLISANPGEKYIVGGPLMFLQTAFVGLSIIYIIFLGIKGYKTTEGETKNRFQYSVIGITLSGIGVLIFNLLLPTVGLPGYPELGAASTIFMVIMMGLGVIGSYIIGTVFASIGLIILTLILVSIILSAALFFFLIFLGIVLNR